MCVNYCEIHEAHRDRQEMLVDTKLILVHTENLALSHQHASLNSDKKLVTLFWDRSSAELWNPWSGRGSQESGGARALPQPREEGSENVGKRNMKSYIYII